MTGSPAQAVHRKQILTLAARHRLPAVYSFRCMAVEGGLIAYGPKLVDHRAADYVDRILCPRPAMVVTTVGIGPLNDTGLPDPMDTYRRQVFLIPI